MLTLQQDKNGSLVPRSQQTQETFNRHVSQIWDKWGVEALQAIPNVRGLRPRDADELGVDHLRFLQLISRLESNLAIVGRDMIAERDARIRTKAPTCANDLTLKSVDLRRLVEKYRSRNASGEARNVAEEVEHSSITLERRFTTGPFASQHSALPVLESSESDPHSPRMLTRCL